MASLTEVRIRSWIKAGRPIARADGGGLTFTLSATGTAAWIVRYRYGGRPREMTLGRYPDISLAKARELATGARAKIQQGSDVAREKQVANVERTTAKSFRQLATSYMAVAFPKMAPNTVRQRRHHVEDVLVRQLGGLAARDVTTGDIVALIETVGQRSKSVAELVLTAASEVFKHGIARHAVPANPCIGITAAAICGARVPRTRISLSDDELRELLAALPSIGPQNAAATRILLGTAARISELFKARWEHVDLDKAEWTIPTSKASKTPFLVPLPSTVVASFRALKVLALGSVNVLPARNQRRRARLGGDVPAAEHTLNAMIDKLCERLSGKIRRFVPHDLRSTARSHLSALHVNVIVAERCLNHSLGGLLAIYDQHDYRDERRAALQAWSDHLLTLEPVGRPTHVIDLAA